MAQWATVGETWIRAGQSSSRDSAAVTLRQSVGCLKWDNGKWCPLAHFGVRGDAGTRTRDGVHASEER